MGVPKVKIAGCALSIGLVLFACAAFGNPLSLFTKSHVFYVSPTGSNGNPGSFASPWGTIAYAVTQLNAGDTLFARGGTYSETNVNSLNSGTTSHHITITAYPGESPVMDAAGLVTTNWSFILAASGAYTDISGFELRNADLNGAIANADGMILSGVYSTARNMLIHDVWSAGMILQNDYEVFEDSTVYRVSLSNCRLATATACGLTVGTTYGTGPWPGCVQSQGAGGTVPTVGVMFQRVLVYDCWGEGIGIFGNNNSIVQDNISFNNFNQNIYINNSKNYIAQRNIVYNAADAYVGASPQISWFSLTNEPGPLQNDSGGIVRNNLFYNTEVCLFCFTQVASTGLNNDVFANNTMINTVFATGDSSSSGVVVNTGTNLVENNITSGGTPSVPSTSGITFSHNAWLTSPPAGAAGTGDVVGNPQVSQVGSTAALALASSYFKLSTGSPMIGAGVTLSQVTSNFAILPSPSPPDIGAF